MKYVSFLLAAGVIALLGNPHAAAADVFKGTPKDAVILPEDGSGVTKVALVFDFSTLRSGENRKIAEAVLDWRLSGISSEEFPEFVAYSVVQAWTSDTVNSGSLTVASADKISDGQVNSLVPETAEGRFLRLDLTTIVREWAGGTRTNYGVVLATSDLDAKLLKTQLAKIQLTVRYGFSDN